jgi:AraC-like DNA-binding protein
MAISMMYPIMKTIAHKGFDTGVFCEYASFKDTLLRDVEARIPEEEYLRLMQAAASFTNDDYFGLYQGKIMDMADLGILGYVMMHSETIVDALEAYRRYNVILCSGFNLSWEVSGEEMLLRLFPQNPAARISRHCMEDMASSLYHLMGRMSNKRLPLRELRFAHAAPPDMSPYRLAFGVEPRFEAGETYFRMDKEVLNYPILYSDRRLREMFERIAQETCDRLVSGRPLSDQVFQWMMTRMPIGLPDLRQTAHFFRMSTRTLQAKLKEEQASFNGLSASARMELAKGYLDRPEHSVGEIAYLLHYSEPSAFQSAFKKWTGVTPSQFRAQSRSAKKSAGAS